MNLEKLLAFLETYKGRDRIFRLLSYASKLGAGLTSQNLSSQLDNFSRQLSTTRAAFRLLDDLPTIIYALQYGFGKKGEESKLRYLNVISNMIDVVFSPIDHISWAIEHNIITSKYTFWDTLNTALWVASLYVNLMSSLLKSSMIFDRKANLLTCGKSDSAEMKELNEAQKKLMLSIIRLGLDIIFAVNYLPPGILWSRFLTKTQVGALGTMSSLIALYQSLK